ncbi:MAG: phosphoglucomutase/phosphomannomutase family protein [Candidatus Omnitrophota bacterium]
MQAIKFGTDGFRGIIADNFTFENVEKIATAFGLYLLQCRNPKLIRGVLIGYDRRFLSQEFAQAFADILVNLGINVLLSEEPVPTPAVSYFIRKNKLFCGVVITASHNPASFNGVKIKNEFGASVESNVTKEIERIISKNINPNFKVKICGKIKKVRITDDYVSFIKRYLNIPLLKKFRYKIVVDNMHGVGAGIIEKILKDTPIKIESIRNYRDVLFGSVNPEPIEKNLGFLHKFIKTHKCDLAIALDGDADRIGAMSASGHFISSHQAICLLLLHLIENKKFTGKVVKSINTTTMVDKITRFYGLEQEEVPVGFKYIAIKMLKENVLLGGEESGGIGFKNYMPERDGVLSGLLLLELMAYKRKSIIQIIREMEKKFGRFVYLRRDLKINTVKKIKHPKLINGKKVVEIKTYDGTKFILNDESWLLIRASGTEPIVRIYAESGNLISTKQLINFGGNLL